MMTTRTTAITLALASVYFLVTMLLRLAHLESNFIMDGFSHVFHIVEYETFSGSLGRHVLIIHQILPVIWSRLGGSLSGIMEAYVVGDSLFYFSVLLVLVLFLKDQIAVLLLISVHILGMPYNHFMMVGELMPGASMAVVALSILRNWSSLSNIKRAALVPAAYFTVSSHPLALVGFLMCASIWWVSVYYQNPRARLLIIAVCAIMVLLKLTLLDDYDVNTINARNYNPLASHLVVSLETALDFSLFFIYNSPIISVLTALCFSILLAFKRYSLLIFGLFLLFSWVLVVLHYLDFRNFSLSFLQSMMHDRYLFPIRFSVVFLFCYVIIPDLDTPLSGVMKNLVYSLWIVGFPFLLFSSRKADLTISKFRDMIEQARKSNLSKAYFDEDQYCQGSYIHRDSFFATIILSNLDTPWDPVHVVHASNEVKEVLSELNDNEVLLMNNLVYNVKEVKARRLKFPSGEYEEISYSCN